MGSKPGGSSTGAAGRKREHGTRERDRAPPAQRGGHLAVMAHKACHGCYLFAKPRTVRYCVSTTLERALDGCSYSHCPLMSVSDTTYPGDVYVCSLTMYVFTAGESPPIRGAPLLPGFRRGRRLGAGRSGLGCPAAAATRRTGLAAGGPRRRRRRWRLCGSGGRPWRCPSGRRAPRRHRRCSPRRPLHCARAPLGCWRPPRSRRCCSHPLCNPSSLVRETPPRLPRPHPPPGSRLGHDARRCCGGPPARRGTAATCVHHHKTHALRSTSPIHARTEPQPRNKK